MERIARGDGDALGELYDDFARLLLALSRRILGTAEEAEDVVQEVFVQVWNQANRYDPRRSSVSTWLVLITRSRSIDRFRSRKVGVDALEKVKQEEPDTHTSSEGDGNVLHYERHNRLRSELDLLPAKQRQVLDLAFFGGLTQSEIANESTPAFCLHRIASSASPPATTSCSVPGRRRDASARQQASMLGA